MKNMAKIALKFLTRTIKTYIKRILDVINYSIELIWNVVINFVVMYIPAYTIYYIMKSAGYFMDLPADTRFNDFVDLPVVGIAGMMLIVGIWEETFFRYLLMDCVMTKWLKVKKLTAMVLSSAIFGYIHLFNMGFPYSVPQAAAACFGGFWFARIYYKQGLHMAILTHALYNFSVVVITKAIFQ